MFLVFPLPIFVLPLCCAVSFLPRAFFHAHCPAPRRRPRSTQKRVRTVRRAMQAAPARTTRTSHRGLFLRTRTFPYSIPHAPQPCAIPHWYTSTPRRPCPTRRAVRAAPARTTRPTRRGALSRTRTLPHDILDPWRPRTACQQHHPIPRQRCPTTRAARASATACTSRSTLRTSHAHSDDLKPRP